MSVTLPQVPWHSQEIAEVAAQLETRLDAGLSTAEAQTRLAQLGLNESARKTSYAVLETGS